MKDIAEKLKSAREATGVSIEEAAEDLNYKVSQLEEIEIGNYKNFKDKFLLKTLITDYAKYLGLDADEIIDEFNDFVFESTSKIPLDDIAKASKQKEKRRDVKIKSPYTATENKNNTSKILIIVLVVLLVIAIVFFCYNYFIKPDKNPSFDVSYLDGGK
ncbi:MAG: helix-turn-helix domain-containing protein [Bacilli bacterium]|nr:helix-turn-helix domain-containing protein [Bacilli bacterium]